MSFFNPSVPNSPFQGVEKRCIGNEWVKKDIDLKYPLPKSSKCSC